MRRTPPFPRAGRGLFACRRLEAVLTVGQRPGRFAAWADRAARREGIETVTTTASAEPTRRDFLYIATATVGAVGAAAVAIPLITQMNPDASTIAAGAPIDVDLAPIAEGQVIKVFWRGKPIFISHRTAKEIKEARSVDWHTLPDPASDEARVKQGHDQWLIVIGICTHLGCIPLAHQGDYGGWFCPCHGSQYDTAARIRRGPAPANLYLPPYQFVSDTKIQIG
jgi:ubiquinol-cytochrome c reductase iron-sulfur subunit